jgi:hypothetical protein
MSAHMHGGGGAFDGQRQPGIQLLEFGNVFTVADGLAHAQPGTLAGAGIVVTVKSFSRSLAGL